MAEQLKGLALQQLVLLEMSGREQIDAVGRFLLSFHYHTPL
jgi:hypothetical protein